MLAGALVRSPGTGAVVAGLVVALGCGEVAGQSGAVPSWEEQGGRQLAAPSWIVEGARRVAPYAQAAPSVEPGRAVLLSAVVPGAGQYALGQRRAWVYLALEAAGWIWWADRRSSAGRLVNEYRDFAWERARIAAGPRVDGDFDYYERLTKWTRSGAFDTDPGAAGIQPETDPTTFNGMIWERAMALFLPGGSGTPSADPGWTSALAYYQSRGYGTELLWDWTGTGEDQDTYADILARSDSHYRQATNVLGAIIANHLVSAVDAFLAARGIATSSEVRVAPGVPGSGTVRWHARVRLPAGR